MTRRRVTDEQYGQLWRRAQELVRRVDEGTLQFESAMSGLQLLIQSGPVVWKTIKLGTGLKTADDFRRALQRGGYRIGDWANNILGQPGFKAATEEKEADLAVVSVAELGFPNGATRENIYRKAQELGLKLCPPEVGPQLRLQYPNQPKDEWLLIGMEPITVSGGFLRVFDVARGDDGLWLGSDGYPDSFWHGSSHWVFLLAP